MSEFMLNIFATAALKYPDQSENIPEHRLIALPPADAPAAAPAPCAPCAAFPYGLAVLWVPVHLLCFFTYGEADGMTEEDEEAARYALEELESQGLVFICPGIPGHEDEEPEEPEEPTFRVSDLPGDTKAGDCVRCTFKRTRPASLNHIRPWHSGAWIESTVQAAPREELEEARAALAQSY